MPHQFVSGVGESSKLQL